MSTTLPKTVPVLEAKDMHKGAFDGPNGTHCLSGWSRLFETVGIERTEDGRCDCPNCRCHRAIMKAAGGEQVVEFNDAPYRPKSTLAATWNRAMRSLGYRKSGKRFVLK